MDSHPNFVPATQNLQRYLRRLSFDEPSIPPAPIDGQFGNDTIAALRAYQDLRGFPVTGVADAATWEQLFADYRASLARNSPPETVEVFPRDPLGFALAQGARGFPVLVLQHMMRELGRDDSALASLAVDAIFGTATRDAVAHLQRISGLPDTGRVDQLTWNLITHRYNNLFSRVEDQ